MAPSITLRVATSTGSAESAFDGDAVLVGRGDSTVLKIDEDGVSAIHAVIKPGLEGRFWVTDLGSERGTQVNGTTIQEPTALSVGDVMSFGAARVEVVALQAPNAEEDVSVQRPPSVVVPAELVTSVVEPASPVHNAAAEFASETVASAAESASETVAAAESASETVAAAESASETVASAAESASETVASAAESASETVASAAESASETVASAAESASETVASAAESASETVASAGASASGTAASADAGAETMASAADAASDMAASAADGASDVAASSASEAAASAGASASDTVARAAASASEAVASIEASGPEGAGTAAAAASGALASTVESVSAAATSAADAASDTVASTASSASTVAVSATASASEAVESASTAVVSASESASESIAAPVASVSKQAAGVVAAATAAAGAAAAASSADKSESVAEASVRAGASSSASPTAQDAHRSHKFQEGASASPAMAPALSGQREKPVKLHHDEPQAGANIVTEDSDIDPALLSKPLEAQNRPTNEEKALEISVLWGDTVVSEAQVRKSGPIRVGNRKARPRPALEVDGGFPASSFTLAKLGQGEASIVVPKSAKVAVRSADGAINREPSMSGANVSFPADEYNLKMGERLVYKSGTITVMAQFVRGNAVMGRTAARDWLFPAILMISLLLHLFFVIATFLNPNLNESLIDDLFKNQNRFAQMILKAPEEEKKRKKLDLSGMKGGAKAKEDEGKFGKKEKPKKDKLASKAGAPRVDPNKREKDRKIAMNAGLLGILKGAGDAGAVSNVFGPGGLGTGINNAMGGLRGTEMGDAGGAGGLGTRGTGAGGGGNSLGIGGLGTHGHGRGTGGYGNIDLGGRGKGRTRIVPGRTIIKGSLSKEAIARVIRRNLARFKFCYEKQLASNPNLGGKISVYFTIAPTGSVAKATVRETSMNDATVEACTLKVMRSLKFPKPKGGGIVVVTYPFVFAAT